MIEVKNAGKYYNRGKQNQIHVINDTTLSLPDTGIACFLGPSGCGKTTLLNAIGGLDTIDSGQIFIDNEQITGRSSRKIDTIRNEKMGYIFQNYNLLDDRTVYENVAIALKMIGFPEKSIPDRVNYCLESVGLYSFRKKLARSLSGGQRQRVAIARAIVKNPRIIIADEPTGNLDSANTLEVMNIIRKISRDKLVILVTHERKLAEFYSDYVMELKDGKIVNYYTNDSSRYLDFQLENKIYLQDMPVHKDLSDEQVKVNVFSDDSDMSDITIAVRGGNLYIDTGGKYNIIDETSSIELIDDHYRAMDESYFEENAYKQDAFFPENYKAKYTSLYKFTHMIGDGWRTIKGFSKVKKVILLGFVLAGMFTFLGVSNALGVIDIDPSDYRATDQHYISVNNPDKSAKLIKKLEKVEGISYALPGDTLIGAKVLLEDYVQSYGSFASLNVSLASAKKIPNGSIIAGRRVKNADEVVVDKMACDKLIKTPLSPCSSVGIKTPEQFVGKTISVPNYKDFKIVGISDTKAPTMFVPHAQMMYILENSPKQSSNEDGMFYDMDEEMEEQPTFLDVSLFEKDIELTSGEMPEKSDEVIVNRDWSEEYPIGKAYDRKYKGTEMTVVGYYSSSKLYDESAYVSHAAVEKAFISQKKYVTVYANDEKKVTAALDDMGLKYTVNETKYKNQFISNRKESLTASLVAAGVMLLISLIEMFLMLRSSFMARIREVGIMRAIGLRKSDVYKMFGGEIIVLTTITTIPGIALMYYILENIVSSIEYIEGSYIITPGVAAISFAILLVFNLIVGLIPVFNTMRKTPAKILSRTDI